MEERGARGAAAAGSRRWRGVCRGSKCRLTEKKEAKPRERPLRERAIGSYEVAGRRG